MANDIEEIISALLESRIEREGKDRLDYIDQASNIINDCFQVT